MLTNRWALLAALLVSIGLWVVLSSATANAVHILAKGNFSWRSYGSVSIWPVVATLLWTAIIYWIPSQRSGLMVKWELLAIVAIAIWLIALLVMTAVADAWLGQVGIAALLIWVVEFVGAVLILAFLQKHMPLLGVPNGWLATSVLAFSLLAAIKACLFCALPGASIRM
jgi:hypothetical protein